MLYEVITEPVAADERNRLHLAVDPDLVAGRITSYNVCYTKLLRGAGERRRGGGRRRGGLAFRQERPRTALPAARPGAGIA